MVLRDEQVHPRKQIKGTTAPSPSSHAGPGITGKARTAKTMEEQSTHDLIEILRRWCRGGSCPGSGNCRGVVP